MKIVHLVLNYYPSIGGTQIVYKGISENCVNIFNDEVEVLTVDSYYGSHSKQYKEIELKTENVNNVLVRRFSFFRSHKKILYLLNVIYFKLTGKLSQKLVRYNIGPWSPSLTKAINTTNADIISASSSTFKYMLYPLYRHKLKNPKPFVFQGAIHFAVDENVNVVAPKTLQAIKASEYYLSNTEYEKRRLIDLGVDENIIVVTGCAVDMMKFSSGNRAKYRQTFKLKETDILIGYIGRLEKTKSIDVLIDAFINAYNENQNLKLVIAGYETDYMKEVKKKIATLNENQKNSIFFLSNLSETDKADLYNALDIFVLPSINESFGIVFLEAWSCKKPVIGVSIGAVASVITDGKDGLLMQPFDAMDLKNHFLRLANDENLRNYLGTNGYKKTEENYTWPIVTKKFRDTYIAAIEKFNNKMKKTIN